MRDENKKLTTNAGAPVPDNQIASGATPRVTSRSATSATA